MNHLVMAGVQRGNWWVFFWAERSDAPASTGQCGPWARTPRNFPSGPAYLFSGPVHVMVMA